MVPGPAQGERVTQGAVVCCGFKTGPSGCEIILFTFSVRMCDNKVPGRKIGPNKKKQLTRGAMHV